MYYIETTPAGATRCAGLPVTSSWGLHAILGPALAPRL